MATYGWKERYDTVAITNALYASENVQHLDALGVSMGAAIALQSAAVEPRIEAVVAEDPFANLREVSYDYAGLHFGPLLGMTLFRPATVTAMDALEKAGGFNPDGVSPEKAVSERRFAVLLICGTRDPTIPCRHAEKIYRATIGPKELWVVQGAGTLLRWATHRKNMRTESFGFSKAARQRKDQVVSTAWVTCFSTGRRTGGTASRYRMALAKHSAATASKAPA
jgi:fermentation-respiration switch protein FrsA (DUF1100 family)